MHILLSQLKRKFGNVIMKESKKGNRKGVRERKGKNMAVLSKPVNKVSVIPAKEASDFVREFNQNKVTKEFIESCEKAGRLFEGKKRR